MTQNMNEGKNTIKILFEALKHFGTIAWTVAPSIFLYISLGEKDIKAWILIVISALLVYTLFLFFVFYKSTREEMEKMKNIIYKHINGVHKINVKSTGFSNDRFYAIITFSELLCVDTVVTFYKTDNCALLKVCDGIISNIINHDGENLFQVIIDDSSFSDTTGTDKELFIINRNENFISNIIVKPKSVRE